MAKGDNENTKATEGKLSVCQSSREVTALEAAGPQKRFIGKEAKECTNFLYISEATQFCVAADNYLSGIFHLVAVPAAAGYVRPIPAPGL